MIEIFFPSTPYFEGWTWGALREARYACMKERGFTVVQGEPKTIIPLQSVQWSYTVTL